MRAFGNILWHFPFFGFISAGVTWLLGLLLTLTIVGAPIGLGLMELGKFFLFPFGHSMVSSAELARARGRTRNLAWRVFSILVLIVYLPLGAILAVLTIVQVGLLFISILGIPAGIVVAESLGTWFNPVGKKCVSNAVVAELERRKAEQQLGA